MQEIIDYIKSRREAGISKEEIKSVLLIRGFQEAHIEEAFALLEKNTLRGKEPQALSEKPLLPLEHSALPVGEVDIKTPARIETQNDLHAKPSVSTLPSEVKSFSHLPPMSSGLAESNPFAQSLQPKSSKKPMRALTPIFLGAIVGIVLVGATAFGFWYVELRDKQLPEDVLASSFQKMGEVVSYRFFAQATAKPFGQLSTFLSPSEESEKEEIQDEEAVDVKQSTLANKGILTIDGNGGYDGRDPNHRKGSFIFNFQADLLEEHLKMRLGLDARIDGETLYIKLNNADLANTALAVLSRFTDKWIKVDIKAVTQQYVTEDNIKQIEEAERGKRLSPQEAAELASIMKQTRPFVIASLPEGTEDGVSVYHFSIMLRGEGVKQFLLASLDLLKKKGLSAKDASTLRQRVNDPLFLEATTKFAQAAKLEVWIGKTDLLLRKVLFQFTPLNDQKQDMTSVTLALKLDAYNEAVSVDIPNESTPLDKVIEEFLESFTPASTPPNP